MNKSDILRVVSKFEYSDNGDAKLAININGKSLKFPVSLSKIPKPVFMERGKEEVENVILEQLVNEILEGEYTNAEIGNIKKYIISKMRDLKIDDVI